MYDFLRTSMFSIYPGKKVVMTPKSMVFMNKFAGTEPSSNDPYVSDVFGLLNLKIFWSLPNRACVKFRGNFTGHMSILLFVLYVRYPELPSVRGLLT